MANQTNHLFLSFNTEMKAIAIEKMDPMGVLGGRNKWGITTAMALTNVKVLLKEINGKVSRIYPINVVVVWVLCIPAWNVTYFSKRNGEESYFDLRILGAKRVKTTLDAIYNGSSLPFTRYRLTLVEVVCARTQENLSDVGTFQEVMNHSICTDQLLGGESGIGNDI